MVPGETMRFDRGLATVGDSRARRVDLPLRHHGQRYHATLQTGRNGWTVDVSDESGTRLPGSGDFAATLLALQR
ncbi:MAG: hypothetical protein JOZ41_06935 [Chloroflexi bacterium]|nr:hypothetical protein [Chloroflexota bacterium]